MEEMHKARSGEGRASEHPCPLWACHPPSTLMSSPTPAVGLLLSHVWLFHDLVDYSQPGSAVHAASQVGMLQSHVQGNKLTQKDNEDSGVQFITPAGPRQTLVLAKNPDQFLGKPYIPWAYMPKPTSPNSLKLVWTKEKKDTIKVNPWFICLKPR